MKKKIILGSALCLAVLAVLAGGFFALRGGSLSSLTGYEESGPTVQLAAPPALVDMKDLNNAVSIEDEEAFAERARLREESIVEEAFPQAVLGFSQKAAPLLLGREENGCFSPLSLYYALALAGSGSQGETQEEFLEVLCAPDLEWLGDQAGRCYRQLFQDNDQATLTIANSLWLQKGYPFVQSFLDNAGEDYFASLFSGDFRDPQLGRDVSQWISDNTQGLLEDPDFWEGLGQFLDGGAYTKVNWSVPKFTVDSQYQLEAMLPQLGFDTACDPEAANFSGISEVERLTLSQTSHGVHFAIDEEGIEAAAYTATGMSGSSGPPPKEIDMVLDRPFLYGVTAFTSTQEAKNGKVDSTLLFLGACGDPTAS